MSSQLNVNIVRILALALPLFLFGCKNAEVASEGGPNFQCLMMAFTSIKVKLISDSPLPNNLAIALNPGDIDADECVNSGLPDSSIRASADRKEIDAEFVLNYLPVDYAFYFQSGVPQSSLLNLDIYSRPSCTDTPVQFYEVQNAQITWESNDPSGSSCVAAYSATTEIPIQ